MQSSDRITAQQREILNSFAACGVMDVIRARMAQAIFFELVSPDPDVRATAAAKWAALTDVEQVINGVRDYAE